jgi:hypothetical protein
MIGVSRLDPAPIAAYITSSEFDLDDGHQFVFVWRVLPDMTFRGSTAANPSATMTLLPLTKLWLRLQQPCIRWGQ